MKNKIHTIANSQTRAAANQDAIIEEIRFLDFTRLLSIPCNSAIYFALLHHE